MFSPVAGLTKEAAENYNSLDASGLKQSLYISTKFRFFTFSFLGLTLILTPAKQFLAKSPFGLVRWRPWEQPAGRCLRTGTQRLDFEGGTDESSFHQVDYFSF